MHTIAIVGGGFSGASLATALLRNPPAQPTRIVLIERRAEIGRGVAYSTRAFPYVLNVPASGMSADPARPLEFVEFARTRRPDVAPGDFLPRALYGDYLIERLAAAEREATDHVELQRVHAEVTSVKRADDGGWRLGMSTGPNLAADIVVLAIGNPRPASIAVGRGLDRASDLWDEAGVVRGRHPVLIIGTALTMADMVTRLEAHSTREAPIHAISRHGFLPHPHSAAHGAPYAGDAGALLRAASTARALLRFVRSMTRDAVERGQDWHDVIAFMRPHVPSLWRALPRSERKRFLRHVRPYWDLHRHRLAPEIERAVTGLRESGLLHVRAARIKSLESWGDQIRATLVPRGGGAERKLVVDYVINCTGPDYRLRNSRDILVGQLLRERLVTPDPLDLGLMTGPSGEVLDAAGKAIPALYYVGPMLRADWWEATAVPELRVHLQRLAGTLAAA
jgi:uncharacterized NAD(P)/FAD-binding protein YdhS